MAPIFNVVMEQLMKSLESDEGIKPQVESKEKADFSLDSDSEEGD